MCTHHPMRVMVQARLLDRGRSDCAERMPPACEMRILSDLMLAEGEDHLIERGALLRLAVHDGERCLLQPPPKPTVRDIV